VKKKIKDSIFAGWGWAIESSEEDTFARKIIAEKYPPSDEEDLTSWYISALPIAIDLQD